MLPMKSSLIIIAALLSTLLSMNVMAVSGVYKWTDDKDQVHYTQYKPTNYESVEVDAPPPPPSVTYDLNEKWAEQIRNSAAASKNKKKQARRDKLGVSDTEKRQKNCEVAKNNLMILENQRIVSYTDESGDKIRMGEEQRETNIQDAEKQIAFFCN